MNDDDYLSVVEETRVYPGAGQGDYGGIAYCAMGLSGEVGEVLNQIKKIFRDDKGIVTNERLAKLEDELGDVLWYLYALSDELALDVENLRLQNAEKLMKRKNETNDIHGDRRESGHIHGADCYHSGCYS